MKKRKKRAHRRPERAPIATLHLHCPRCGRELAQIRQDATDEEFEAMAAFMDKAECPSCKAATSWLTPQGYPPARQKDHRQSRSSTQGIGNEREGVQ